MAEISNSASNGGEGGAIYISDSQGLINNTEFEGTTSKGYGGALYVNGEVEINNATFKNFKSSENQANAIFFDGGNSTLSKSTLEGTNPILISGETQVHLTKNNNTQAAKGLYSVFNNGVLYLDTNKFESVIEKTSNK